MDQKNIKDPYYILDLDRMCTHDEIKKSYRRLALKYHPDKSLLPNSNNHFLDVLNAYQILSDPIKRKQYDSLTIFQQMQLFDNLKSFMQLKIPNLDHYIKLFFEDEQQLKTYIDSMNLFGIYNQILEKIPNINIIELLSSPVEINIHGKLTVTFQEKYMNKYRKILVNRLTREPHIFHIPLNNTQHIISQEGEIDRINNMHGDVIIDIELSDERYPDFSQMGNDIYYTRAVSLYEYLYGGEFTLKYFDSQLLVVKFDSFVEKYPMITIENKGMLLSAANDGTRGKLFIIFKIDNLEALQTQIKKNMSPKIKPQSKNIY
ncbi:MAG: DnaJ domain protein [Hyperionvirus sp.]|uniref:DnaJ domain protein n=1 Tax=Hyperionvirus sp. TaxID=2487770 RepID=A0A3G5ACV4_9VIRU|nr:MAG: DnaJ domain protein [Hyperionvirus sp.]